MNKSKSKWQSKQSRRINQFNVLVVVFLVARRTIWFWRKHRSKKRKGRLHRAHKWVIEIQIKKEEAVTKIQNTDIRSKIPHTNFYYRLHFLTGLLVVISWRTLRWRHDYVSDKSLWTKESLKRWKLAVLREKQR